MVCKTLFQGKTNDRVPSVLMALFDIDTMIMIRVQEDGTIQADDYGRK